MKIFSTYFVILTKKTFRRILSPICTVGWHYSKYPKSHRTVLCSNTVSHLNFTLRQCLILRHICCSSTQPISCLFNQRRRHLCTASINILVLNFARSHSRLNEVYNLASLQHRNIFRTFSLLSGRFRIRVLMHYVFY